MKIQVSDFDKYPKFSMTVDGLTQSMLGVAMECPRKLWFFLNRLRNPTSQENYAFGTLMHNIMEAVYNGTIKTDEEIGAYIDSLEDKDVKKTALAFALSTAYLHHYNKEIVSGSFQCEKSFNFLYNGKNHSCRFRGKRDLLFTNGKGKNLETWLMEHKFWSQINPDQLVNTLFYDFQVMFYCWTYWNETGIMPKGIVYNIVRKPQNKMKDEGDPIEFQNRVHVAICEKPEYYFYRVPIAITKSNMARFEKDLMSKLNYVKYVLSKEVYRNEFSCFSKYVCEFHDACFSENTKLLSQSNTLFPELEE